MYPRKYRIRTIGRGRPRSQNKTAFIMWFSIQKGQISGSSSGICTMRFSFACSQNAPAEQKFHLPQRFRPSTIHGCFRDGETAIQCNSESNRGSGDISNTGYLAGGTPRRSQLSRVRKDEEIAIVIGDCSSVDVKTKSQFRIGNAAVNWGRRHRRLRFEPLAQEINGEQHIGVRAFAQSFFHLTKFIPGHA